MDGIGTDIGARALRPGPIKDSGEVEREMKELAMMIEALDMTTRRLVEKLGPVLSPVGPERGADSKGQPQTRTALGEGLRGLKDRVSGIFATLDDATGRLEL